MATGIQVAMDCADPDGLARFWATALGYKLEDPPEGYTSWPKWLTAHSIPEEEWNSASAIVDPDGKGPRLWFQRVPEPKTVKNRVHMDLNISGGRGTPLPLSSSSGRMTIPEGIGLQHARLMHMCGRDRRLTGEVRPS